MPQSDDGMRIEPPVSVPIEPNPTPAAKDAAECFGAMGVMRDMPLQKYIHDTRMFLHTGDGSTDAKLRIAEALAGYR